MGDGSTPVLGASSLLVRLEMLAPRTAAISATTINMAATTTQVGRESWAGT